MLQKVANIYSLFQPPNESPIICLDKVNFVQEMRWITSSPSEKAFYIPNHKCIINMICITINLFSGHDISPFLWKKPTILFYVTPSMFLGKEKRALCLGRRDAWLLTRSADPQIPSKYFGSTVISAFLCIIHKYSCGGQSVFPTHEQNICQSSWLFFYLLFNLKMSVTLSESRKMPYLPHPCTMGSKYLKQKVSDQGFQIVC